MTSAGKLITIKLIHTIIWVFFNVVLFYLLYAVATNDIDVWVWVCIGLVVAEGLVLLLFGNMCPLTLMARHYSTSEKANFDIYLPEWLARHNKVIYTGIFIATIVLLVFRLWQGYGE